MEQKGHQIMFGSRDVQKAKSAGDELKQEGGSIYDAVRFGEIILLGIPWSVAIETVQSISSLLDSKILIDITNHVDPEKDWEHIHLDSNTSAAQEIAKVAKDAKVVKAFNTIVWSTLENPIFGSAKANVFVCGDDKEAKAKVFELVTAAGFEPINSGPLKNAYYVESLANFWMNLAFVQEYGSDTVMNLVRR